MRAFAGPLSYDCKASKALSVALDFHDETVQENARRQTRSSRLECAAGASKCAVRRDHDSTNAFDAA